jgi:hypothetical protein
MDFCKTHEIEYRAIHDFLIVPIDAVPARKVFTPFYKLRQKYLEANPQHQEPISAPNHISSPKIHVSSPESLYEQLQP